MWNISFREPIGLDNGQVLRTLEDVRLLVVSIPSDIRRQEKWQRVCDLLIQVATSGAVDLLPYVPKKLEHALETPPYAKVRLMPKPTRRADNP